MKFRLISSEHMNTTLHEIDTYWCIDDVCDAHDMLDAIEDAIAVARRG